MNTSGPTPFRANRTIRTTLAILGFGLLAWLTWDSREELSRLLADCNISLLSASVALGIVFTLAHGALFANLVRKHGGSNTGTIALASAYLMSQPGKYIPGKVWSIGIQMLALEKTTRLPQVAIANVELAMVAAAQSIAMGIALLFGNSLLLVCLLLAAGSIACAAISVFPSTSLLSRLAPKLSLAMGLGNDSSGSTRFSILRAIGLNAACMALNIAASWCVLLATTSGVSDADRLPVLSSLYLGIAAGILALPVPAGIGVREVAAAGLGTLLFPSVPPPLVISVALLFRCWQIPVDIGCLAFGVLISRQTKASGPQLED